MKALVTAEFPPDGLAELSSPGYEPVHAGWGVTRQTMTEGELIASLGGTEILICELERVGGTVLAAARDLRLVASCRGNPTNIDLEAAASHGITVLAAPGRNAISVADFTLGLLLDHCRRIGRSERQLREDGWMVNDDLPYFHFRGPELDGRTMGLVGLGAIGRLVSDRARGFGMSVLISILITFLVIILVLYLVQRLPIDGRAKQIVQIIVVVIGILSLLKYIAVF
jgi:phosphoglycerate dehydrogenase-like enzyme